MRYLPARRWPRLTIGCFVLVSALHAAPVSASEATIAGPVSLPASMPLRRDEATPAAESVWGAVVAVLMVAGAGGTWWWRRRGRGEARHRTRARAVPVVMLASRSLTPQASVHAIEWKGEELLVACTAQNVTVLSRRTLPQTEQPS